MTVVAGIWRGGRVELDTPPENVAENTAGRVTFLAPGEVDLAAYGISPTQAAELRGQLSSFADDWSVPDMAAYDDYDAARAKQP